MFHYVNSYRFRASLFLHQGAHRCIRHSLKPHHLQSVQ